MRTASADYISAINAGSRPTSQVRVTVYADNGGAVRRSSITYTNCTAFSTGLNTSESRNFSALENNFFRVGYGQSAFSASNPPTPSGLTSSEVSGANGAFTNKPVITIPFSKATEITRIRFNFHTDYATSINIVASRNGTTVASYTYEPTSAKSVSSHAAYTCDKIVFTINGLSAVGHRMRLKDILFETTAVFTNDDLVSLVQNHHVDPLNATLPYNHVDATFFDLNHEFDPENPKGSYTGFKRGQRVQVEYGTITNENNGTIEWVAHMLLYLADRPVFEDNKVTITAVDVISLMNRTYSRGVAFRNGTSLGSLGREVITDANVNSSLVASTRLTTTRTTAPLPVAPSNECLQLIASAARCTLRTSDSDNIVMTAQDMDSFDVLDYHLTYDNMMSRPRVTKLEPLKNITVHWWGRAYGNERSNIASLEEYDLNGDTEINLTHNEAIDVRVEGDSAVLSKSYAESSVLIPRNSAASTIDVSLTGIQTRKVQHDYRWVNDSILEGESISVSNPLITSKALAESVATRTAKYYANTSQYEVDIRQDYLLEAGDVIYMQTQYEQNLPIIITDIRYSLPGQVGHIKGRRVIGNAVDNT